MTPDATGFRFGSVTVPWAQQKENRRRRPSDGDNAPSYEAFKRLSPIHSLIREECRLLKKRSDIVIDSDGFMSNCRGCDPSG